MCLFLVTLLFLCNVNVRIKLLTVIVLEVFMNFYSCVDFIKKKHGGQMRKHGTPYYLHPLGVSNILKEKGFSLEYQVVGLFHDLLEDTNATYDEIESLSSNKVLDAVKLLTKTDGYVMSDYINGIMSNDMAKMVKLADRIHNLSEAHLAGVEFQNKYIKETKDWYVAMAKNTVFEKDLNIVLERLKKSKK